MRYPETRFYFGYLVDERLTANAYGSMRDRDLVVRVNGKTKVLRYHNSHDAFNDRGLFFDAWWSLEEMDQESFDRINTAGELSSTNIVVELNSSEYWKDGYGRLFLYCGQNNTEVVIPLITRNDYVEGGLGLYGNWYYVQTNGSGSFSNYDMSTNYGEIDVHTMADRILKLNGVSKTFHYMQLQHSESNEYKVSVWCELTEEELNDLGHIYFMDLLDGNVNFCYNFGGFAIRTAEPNVIVGIPLGITVREGYKKTGAGMMYSTVTHNGQQYTTLYSGTIIFNADYNRDTIRWYYNLNLNDGSLFVYVDGELVELTHLGNLPSSVHGIVWSTGDYLTLFEPGNITVVQHDENRFSVYSDVRHEVEIPFFG